MENGTIRRIVRMYGLEAAHIFPGQKGYRNETHPVKLTDGRMVNIMLYKSEPRITELIARANSIGAFLARSNLPVRSPADPRIVQLSHSTQLRYASMYTYLPGKTIPWEAYTRHHIKELGRALAELHTDLAGYDGVALPRVTDEYGAIVGRMEQYFTNAQARQALSDKLGLSITNKVFTHISHILAFCEKLAGQQALHMDFVRSNILFSDSHDPQIIGIIDFEKAAYGHPLFDVARTLAFLLVDCKYKPAGKVRKYFLQSGYQKRGGRRLAQIAVRMSGGRRPLLEELLDLSLIYDFYKFLRHNPFEFLEQNEHFVRTRDLLLARNVITTTSGQ